MANLINGTSTGSGGLITTGDSSDELQLQTAETARVTLTNTAVVVNEDGNDVDFRVEGDTNANLLFVDASADAVGIGTNAPVRRLQVQTATTGTVDAISWSDGATDTGYLGVVSGGGVRLWAGGFLALGAGGGASFTERMRIDSSGNVGIGTSSPNKTSIGRALTVNGSANAGLELTASDVCYGLVFANSSRFSLDTNNSGANIINFYTSGSERMRIDSSGLVGIGLTPSGNYRLDVSSGTGSGKFATSSTTATVLELAPNSDNTTQPSLVVYSDSAAATRLIIYSNGNVVNTNNSYGPISDVKLKKDIVDAGSQWDDLKAIRIRKFRFKNDPDGVLQIGVIAQELEEVSPGLVSEHPDHEMVQVPVLDDDGNPVLDEGGNPITRQEQQATGETTKSVKATVLYMKAVKALQEAMERIETLEASNTALEARIAALENA